MIQIVQGFKLSTRDAVDNRLLLSKAEMLVAKDNQMPDKYFAICKDDGKLYLYDKAATPSEETGKYSLFSSAKIESISINGEVLPISNFNVDLPLATAQRYGMVIPGYGLKSEDGMLSIDFNAIEDGSIPVAKIDWSETIISGDNINVK